MYMYRKNKRYQAKLYQAVPLFLLVSGRKAGTPDMYNVPFFLPVSEKKKAGTAGYKAMLFF